MVPASAGPSETVVNGSDFDDRWLSTLLVIRPKGKISGMSLVDWLLFNLNIVCQILVVSR